MGDTLSTDEKVTPVGFGTFQVVNKKARRGVNRRTRETIQILAKKIPKFVPGKSLREKVRSPRGTNVNLQHFPIWFWERIPEGQP